MLVGQGARGCAAELIEVADLFGAGAAKALLGKDVLPDDLPWVTGSIGLLGTTASWHLMRDCDTLLTVGSNFPYTQFLPDLDQARAVQIDHSGKWIGMRYPYEINLVGDAKAHAAGTHPAARAQTGPVVARTHRETRGQLVDHRAAHRDDRRRPGQPDADLLGALRADARQRHHRRRFRARRPTGMPATCKFSAGVRGSLSGTLATMGPGVPVRHRRQVGPPGPTGDRLRR